LSTINDIFLGCKRGDAQSQKLLYKQYGPVLKGICGRYFKDTALCSDMLQDTFIKIFDKISQFNEEGSFEGWMKRIAVTTCIDYIRKNKTRFTAEEIDANSDFVQENEEEEYNIVNEILEIGFSKQVLFDFLHQLPDKQRLIFNLFCLDKLTHKEIAEKLDTSEAMSRKLLCKSRETLRVLLTQYVQQHKMLVKT